MNRHNIVPYGTENLKRKFVLKICAKGWKEGFAVGLVESIRA
jgi:hypothetical protein